MEIIFDDKFFIQAPEMMQNFFSRRQNIFFLFREKFFSSRFAMKKIDFVDFILVFLIKNNGSAFSISRNTLFFFIDDRRIFEESGALCWTAWNFLLEKSRGIYRRSGKEESWIAIFVSKKFSKDFSGAVAKIKSFSYHKSLGEMKRALTA